FHAGDLDLDRSDAALGFAPQRLPSRNSRSNVHNRRHEPQFVCLRRSGLSVSQLTAPAKQLLRRQSMASGHGTNRVSARRDLGNYPDLVFITPCPPSPGAGEHFQPTDRLGDNTMFSIHSKPNGPKPGRRLADQDIIRKVGAEHRLRSTRTWTRTNPVLAMLPSGEYTLTTRDNIASQTGECGEAREVLRLFQALL